MSERTLQERFAPHGRDHLSPALLRLSRLLYTRYTYLTTRRVFRRSRRVYHQVHATESVALKALQAKNWAEDKYMK
jgi:hypothetical protein